MNLGRSLAAVALALGTLEMGGCPIPVNLDIKPGSCPNSFNPDSRGVLPIAICRTAEFDVTQIDLESLVLTGGVTPLMGPPGPGIRIQDVATPFKGDSCDCHDLDGDGIDDLLMRFDTPQLATALDLHGLPRGTVLTLFVSGSLLDGTSFTGWDCVTVPGGQAVNNIARWDGGTWSQLGSGMNAPVRALAVYNGELIAGGDFTAVLRAAPPP